MNDVSVLDLQSLKETSEKEDDQRKPSGSRASKGCNNNASGLSLLLC